MAKIDYARRRDAVEQQRRAITDRYKRAGQSHEHAAERARREMERAAPAMDRELDKRGR